MTGYERFQQLHIDHSAIGMMQRESFAAYACTPRDADVIGWAGVDGIHYCTIPEFGDMIFAVSPMNLGDYVHPIARSFEDLLRMLLLCADMAALEQCYAWDEEQFKAFLIDCPATREQQLVLDAIRKEFGLEPMEEAFAYVKQLQSEFDLSRIPYTEDYYDPDMNPAAPVQPAAWKVTYDGGFWSEEGNAGFEVPIGKCFCWGSESWQVPAVYLCDEGLVVDYFMESDPALVTAFIDKWDLLHEARNHYTKEQQEQIRREHPLHVSFQGHITCNGHPLRGEHSCGLTWIPSSCIPDGSRQNSKACVILEHYGLDPNRAWAIHRSSYRWGDVSGLDIRSLSVRMERHPENLAGQHFPTPAAGDSIVLSHPLTGQAYTLTIHEAEQQELPEDVFRDPSMEYPTHYTAMSYSLEPDIHDRGFLLQDLADGDSPRQKTRDELAAYVNTHASMIGIIGGSDGPTAIILGQHTPKLHAACSSLHFEPVEKVEWRAVFCEKLMEDLCVELL